MCIHQWKIEGTTVSRLTRDVNIPRQRPHSFIFAIADASTCVSKPPSDLSVSTLSSVHCDRTSQGRWPNRLSGVGLRSGPSRTNASGVQYGGELLVRFGFSQRDRASSTATLRQRWLRSLNACRDLEKNCLKGEDIVFEFSQGVPRKASSRIYRQVPCTIELVRVSV